MGRPVGRGFPLATLALSSRGPSRTPASWAFHNNTMHPPCILATILSHFLRNATTVTMQLPPRLQGSHLLHDAGKHGTPPQVDARSVAFQPYSTTLVYIADSCTSSRLVAPELAAYKSSFVLTFCPSRNGSRPKLLCLVVPLTALFPRRNNVYSQRLFATS